MYKRLILSFDAGSSMTKIIYGWIDEENEYVVKYMVMGPEYLILPSASGKYMSYDLGMGLPEDNAWVRYQKNGKIVVLGRMAREYRAMSRLKPLKAEIIIPKIMGIIGAIAEKEDLGQAIELELGILLPYGEMESKEQLIKNLNEKLKSFYFRNKKIIVKMEQVKVYPEASGIAMACNIAERKRFKQTDRAFLMLGHRNTSLLIFEKGSFSSAKSATTNFGFYHFIDKFRSKLSGVEREDVLRTISMNANVVYDWKRENFELENSNILIDFQRIDGGKDLESIKEACQDSLGEYWGLISSWLEEFMLAEIDEIWSCGGASPFVNSQLKAKFPKIALFKSQTQTGQMWKALGYTQHDYPKELVQENLVERLTDVWGLFMVFSNYFTRMEVSV